ncbi:MAG: NAD(P)-dependent oxidoreductase [Deltaproteobacteria bacterium]|nr:NAD(P)-dependent oxidoreductase [Deltaproteobacteria bacterium]
MTVLVTGATGYLGTALVPKLHDAGYTVRILARPSSDTTIFSGLRNVEIFHGDVTSKESMEGIEKDIEYLFHLAVLGHYGNVKDDQDYFDVNKTGSLNLLEHFVGSEVKKILFTTTSGALGAIPHKTVTENDFTPPVTPYGMSKYKAELSIKKFAEKHGIPYVMVRLTHVYGPGEMRDLYSIIKMMKRGIFPQVGFSPNLFPAVYVDDAMNGLMLAMEKGRLGETYIISDKTSHDLRTIRRFVRKHLGITSRLYPIFPKYPMLVLFTVLDWISDRTGIRFPASRKNIQFITAGRSFSIQKAKRELGYKPAVSLDEGLRKTVEYYLQEKLI